MSARDRELAAMIIRSDGYRKTIGAVDGEKVAAELRGERRPRPANLLAQVAVELIRRGQTTVPSQSAELATIWKRDGVFTRTLSSFHGELRAAARAAGFSWVAVQLDHTPYVEANERELELIGAELRATGWLIVGWATYGDGTPPLPDAIRHAGIARRLGLSGWIANGESWAEGEHRWKSSAYVAGWREAGAPCPIAVSCLSSTTSQWAREFDYGAWLGLPGCAVMPQVYAASDPAYTLRNCIETMGRGGVPVGRLAPTFNVIGGGGPFGAYREWRGPRSIYTGDDSTVDTWKELAR